MNCSSWLTMAYISCEPYNSVVSGLFPGFITHSIFQLGKGRRTDTILILLAVTIAQQARKVYMIDVDPAGSKESRSSHEEMFSNQIQTGNRHK